MIDINKPVQISDKWQIFLKQYEIIAVYYLHCLELNV